MNISSLSLPISETFLSIQGESTYTGCLCWFIRLYGCNLQCSYCDTKYAWDGNEQPVQKNVTNLVKEAIKSGAKYVELTGGEPLIHPEITALSQSLIESGLTVLIETNGSCDLNLVPPPAIRIMDIKTPSSGMVHSFYWDNLKKLHFQDEVKFVIQNREDYEFSMNFIKQYHLNSLIQNIIFSPNMIYLKSEQLASWLIKDKLDVRLGLQLHKLIWEKEERGV